MQLTDIAMGNISKKTFPFFGKLRLLIHQPNAINQKAITMSL